MFTTTPDPLAGGAVVGHAVEADPAAGPYASGSSCKAFDAASPYTVALGSAVDRLEAIELRIRTAEAERVAVLAEIFDLTANESDRIVSTPQGARAELAYRAARAEVAACLHQSEHVAERQLSHAYTLTRDYRAVFDAYGEGAISQQHTAVIIDAGMIIGNGAGSPDSLEAIVRRAEYERAVLAYAVQETPNRLRPIARRLAEQYAQRSLDERYAEAKSRRRVHVIDAEDGMADLYAHLPAVEAYAIHDRLTRFARSAEAAEVEEEQIRVQIRAREREQMQLSAPDSRRIPAENISARTRDEIRADAFIDLLLGGLMPGGSTSDGPPAGDLLPGGSGLAEAGRRKFGLKRTQARVQVVIHEQHLAISGAGPGVGGEQSGTGGELAADELFAPPPPVLEGYGPIDTASARALADAASHWETVRVRPETGTILSVDRYRPSERMRRLLGARDQHCRFFGCRVSVYRCDVDHTVDAALGGSTATDNLALLCRGHHTLKHQTGWEVEQLGGGLMRWTSPTGRQHVDLPERAERAAWETNGVPDHETGRVAGPMSGRMPSRVRFAPATMELEEVPEADGSTVLPRWLSASYD